MKIINDINDEIIRDNVLAYEVFTKDDVINVVGNVSEKEINEICTKVQSKCNLLKSFPTCEEFISIVEECRNC